MKEFKKKQAAAAAEGVQQEKTVGKKRPAPSPAVKAPAKSKSADKVKKSKPEPAPKKVAVPKIVAAKKDSGVHKEEEKKHAGINLEEPAHKEHKNGQVDHKEVIQHVPIHIENHLV